MAWMKAPEGAETVVRGENVYPVVDGVFEVTDADDEREFFENLHWQYGPAPEQKKANRRAAQQEKASEA